MCEVSEKELFPIEESRLGDTSKVFELFLEESRRVSSCGGERSGGEELGWVSTRRILQTNAEGKDNRHKDLGM